MYAKYQQVEQYVFPPEKTRWLSLGDKLQNTDRMWQYKHHE